MSNGYAVNCEEGVERNSDLFHFFDGHGFVGLVFEMERFAAVRLFADATVEGNHGAVIRLANMTDERVGGNGIAAEEDERVVGRESHFVD